MRFRRRRPPAPTPPVTPTYAHGDVQRVTGRITDGPTHATTHLACTYVVTTDVADVHVHFTGRAHLTGLSVGRGITLTGRLVRVDDHYAVHNPRYDLHPRHPDR